MDDIIKILAVVPDGVKEPLAMIVACWLVISTYGSFKSDSLVDVLLVDWLKVRKRRSRHLNCPVRDDALEFGSAAADYFGSLVLFHDAGMKDKMNTLEHKLVAMKSTLESVFFKELERLDPGGTHILSDDFRVYQLVTDLFVRHIKDFGRIYIRDNGYDQMTEAMFDSYCKDVINTCLEEGHRFLNIYYPSTNMMRITRERLHAINEPVVPVIAQLISDSLKYARYKSLEYNAKLEEKRLKYEELMALFKQR
jgi:hypothetical protein